MTVSAIVLADSISPSGSRLTTFQVSMHRFVLAEFNTHRVLSRNFRSSRAVPVAKLLAEVRENPAMPVTWLSNKPGMQGSEPLPESVADDCKNIWWDAAYEAAEYAEVLMQKGLHKSWANRVLEPYLYVPGVVSGTDFANFYALRRHPDAQPEIRALAEAMYAAQEASTPRELVPGQWHLPYVDAQIEDDGEQSYRYHLTAPGELVQGTRFIDLKDAIKTSVVRCARVTYKTFDGLHPDMDSDLALYDKLLGSTPLHASPAEHQATLRAWGGLKSMSGNFNEDWVQYRKTLPGEFVPG